jgi:DNA-directed RNA polymerase specialized sigma subunit
MSWKLTVEQRNALVLRYQRLVRATACRFDTMRPANYPREDLEGDLNLRLIGIIERYDPGKGATLPTFLVSNLRWYALTLCNQARWGASGARNQCASLAKTLDTLTQELKRRPTLAEVADSLGVTEQVVSGWLARFMIEHPLSLESPVQSHGSESSQSTLSDIIEDTGRYAQVEQVALDRVWLGELARTYGRAGETNWEMLVERSKGRNLEEIGEDYGLSKERIRQRLNKARQQLAEVLA